VSERGNDVSPQVWARAGGALYLLIFVLAGVAMELQSKLIVSGDAAATAAHIMASPVQWRISMAAELTMFGCDIPLAVIFYVLLRPVNANLSLLAAFWRFAEAVMASLAATIHMAPLFLFSGASYLKAFDAAQLQALAYVSLRLYDYGFGVALIPFGLHCILLGYLIYRSTYFPKTFGVLMALAGLAYVANTLALTLAPSVTSATFIAMLITGVPAELGFTIWLLVFGVNVQRWNSVILRLSLS
jgi:hypothetical protein